MRSLWHSGKDVGASGKAVGESNYGSTLAINSLVYPGVTFTINRISFGRRMDLCRRVRELGQRLQFLEAGDRLSDKIESNFLAHEIDQVYLEWGLVGVDGLLIDGEPATPDLMLAAGPEPLAKEIVEAIRGQCGLNEEERKN